MGRFSKSLELIGKCEHTVQDYELCDFAETKTSGSYIPATNEILISNIFQMQIRPP